MAIKTSCYKGFWTFGDPDEKQLVFLDICQMWEFKAQNEKCSPDQVTKCPNPGLTVNICISSLSIQAHWTWGEMLKWGYINPKYLTQHLWNRTKITN